MTDKSPQIISGLALVGEELAPLHADIIVEHGTITAIEENPRAPPLWICPALFNAHTHLGDTIAMDCGATGDLVSLVTPPDGLKHRLLRAASRDDLAAGMRASIGEMIGTGTAGCADFREGGEEGVILLRDASRDLPFHAMAFGRDGGERVSDGTGISSARDVAGVERIVAEARKAGKKVAFHAGERDAGDVDAALSFDPDFIVHGTHATKKQLRTCAEKGIPVVICPRSNWTLGVTDSAKKPPVMLMQELGCTIWLGTDNVMFVPPDLGGEMAFVSTLYKTDPASILRSAIAGSVLTGSQFFLSPGARACLRIIDPEQNALKFSRDPVTSMVKRAPFSCRGTNVFNS
ncbi:amidohydrolase family protein [Methanoregula formicica]|uniref:Cytosine deaminase-like metal-dependent hydrolase n=1 Tax=Methanoregula formicica (strain DSM 22288 / NBRC 105244 / SMSP) TaxID=593750 RepID=L0HGD7_METFS|nr:amidohydrolase family protein [Methanoregula formicica]AGB02851.1 cytosine deaminase-like metal-dependent hydrolase [Methanoregula formicica SMSP]